MKTQTILAIAIVTVLSGRVALAQQSAGAESEHSIRATAAPRPFSDVPVVPTGFALQLGGGVTGFSRHGARDTFGVGGYWDARAILGTRSFLGAELAYVGSARDIKASGVDGNAKMMGNGAEALARGNLPMHAGPTLITPYLFGGVGWTYYQIVNNNGSNTSGIKDHANALTIPFGTGVNVSYNHFLADARFTYRAVVDDKLVPTTGNDDHLDLQNWSAGATVGYEF
jgi:hypothetical protein